MGLVVVSTLIQPAVRWLRMKFARNLVRAAVVLGILLIPSYKVYNVENNVYDLFVKLRFLRATSTLDKAQPDIVLILIDDEARRRDEHRWLVRKEPTSRLYLARLIETLTAFKGPPAVIGVDFRLDCPVSNPAEDETLARSIDEAIKSGIRVVLGTVLIEPEGFTRPLLPLNIFLRNNSVGLGFTNFLQSSADGVVRRGDLSFPLVNRRTSAVYITRDIDKQILFLADVDVNGQPHHLSFAAALLEPPRDKTNGQRLESQIGKPPFWIDFSAPSHLLFRLHSSAQLLEGRIPEGSLAGSIVILGSSYDGSLDRVLTPVSRSVAPWSGLWGINAVSSHDLPGGIVHAYAVHTLRQLIRGRAPFHVGAWIPVLIGLIIGSLQAWMGMRRYSLLAVPESVLVLPILYVFVCLWLFISGYGFLPVVRPIAAFVFSFASSGYILRVIGGTHEYENTKWIPL